MAVNFEIYRHPVLAVPCPDCRANVGVMCIRPSGHNASDFHKMRKSVADEIFIHQHGEQAWIERLSEGWRVHPYGYNTELTPEGEQTVIPGCERNQSPKLKQMELF